MIWLILSIVWLFILPIPIMLMTLYAWQHHEKYLLSQLTIRDLLCAAVPLLRIYYLLTAIHIIGKQREWRVFARALFKDKDWRARVMIQSTRYANADYLNKQFK